MTSLMSHTLEALLGGRPVNEETVAEFLMESMPPGTKQQVEDRLSLLLGEYGPNVAAEIRHIGIPDEFWRETSGLDEEKLQIELIKQLTNLRPYLD